MGLPIEQLGSVGLVLDTPGYSLSGPAITGGSNFRCNGESLEAANGYSLFTTVNDGADVPVYHMDGIQDRTGNIYYEVFCGATKVFAYDGATLTAITPAAPLTSSKKWSTDVINGNFVFANGISFIHASLQALNRILPPRIIISLFTTIGLISSISGKFLTLSTSFLNLSSLIIRGLFGFAFISDIFIRLFCIL